MQKHNSFADSEQDFCEGGTTQKFPDNTMKFKVCGGFCWVILILLSDP